MVINFRKISIKLLNLFIEYFWIFAVSSVIIFFIGAYFFIFRNKYELVSEIMLTERKDIMKGLSQKKNFLNALKTEETRIETLDSFTLEKIDAIIPKEKNIPKIIRTLNILAEKSGFLLEYLNFHELETSDPFYKKLHKKIELPENIKMLMVDLSITGNGYEAVKNFVKLAENDLSLIEIMIIRFKTKNTFNLKAMVYYREDF